MRHQGRGAVDWLSGNLGTDNRSRIARVVAMSNRCLGDVVNQSGIDLAWAIIAVIRSALQVDGACVPGGELLAAHQTRHQGRGAVDWLSANRGTDRRSRITN